MRVKGAHGVQEMMRTCVRGSVAYPVSDRQREALMPERGVSVDQATINRGVLTDSPRRAEACHRRKRPGWRRWRMDETSIQVNGEGRDGSRAVDTHGQTMDCLRMEPRATEAARRVLTHALRRHGGPETRPMDGRAAHEAALTRDNAQHGTRSILRQVKSLPQIVEQDHRGVTRVTRPL